MRRDPSAAWNALTVLALLGAGLYARTWGLDAYMFNPDEVLQLSIAGADGVHSVLQIALDEVAHPPGFILLLHGMLQLGDGELFLRSVSLLPGLLSIPVAFALGRRASGTAAGLFMAFVTTFGYASVQLSQVVRPYAWIMLLLNVALLCLIEWDARRRPALLWGYGAAMGAAALLHLSSVIPAAAIGVVVLVRLLRARGPCRETWGWIGVNAAVGSVYLAVFVVVILPLIGSDFRNDAVSTYLSPGYPGGDSPIPWIRNLLMLCVYFTSPFNGWSGLAFLALVAAGLPLLWRSGRSDLALITLAALVLNGILSLLELYPFSGSRHCSYLFPLFALAAGCAFQAPWSRVQKWFPAAAEHVLVKPAATAALVAACLVAGAHMRAHDAYRAKHTGLEFPLTREAYARTLESFEQAIAPGDIVVTEDQVARYALWEGSIRDREKLAPDISRTTFRGREIYYYDSPRMMFFTVGELLGFVERLAEIVPLEPGSRIWFVSLGFRHSAIYTVLLSPEPINVPAGLTEAEVKRERLAFRRLNSSLKLARPDPVVTGGAEGGGVLYSVRWANLQRIAQGSR